jgi:hypothetical protein
MELTKGNREALIEELDESKKELQICNELIEYHQEKENKRMLEYCEIDLFLIEQKIKLIETALINNEIEL